MMSILVSILIQMKKSVYINAKRVDIADGVEFEICPPGTSSSLFDKVKY